jgi:hypothetical protein
MNNNSYRFGIREKFIALKSTMCFCVCCFLIPIVFSSCSKDEIPIPETNDLMVKLESYTLDPVYPRAGRNSTLYLRMINTGADYESGKVQLILPADVSMVGGAVPQHSFISWKSQETKTLKFIIKSHSEELQEIKVKALVGASAYNANISLKWNPQVTITSGTTPAPQAVSTGKYLVGAQRCDLWRKDGVWGLYKDNKFPERQPVIGWYKEGEPDVTDWEIKYALEHGISYFMHCWYRKEGNAGQPLITEYDHVMKSYKTCKFGNQIKFLINWVNSDNRGISGVEDLMDNVFPELLKYFKESNYLKIDNKPILGIYGPSAFISELGGEAKAKAAIQAMNQKCIDAGFAGIMVWGQFCWGASTSVNQPFKNSGMEYIYSYHVPTFGQVLSSANAYTGSEIFEGHKTYWKNQAQYASLPNILTVSMGWNSAPWGFMTSKKTWRLTPDEYKSVLQEARKTMDTYPQDKLQSKMILLDNWNEYGEGHYIFPTRQYGFGYLDAVRSVFAPGSQPHIDLVPEDVGMNLNVW